MAQITVNEGLSIIKSLKQRHAELAAMRSENSTRENRFYGTAGDKTIEKIPVYDVKKLDQTVSRLAMEMRKLDTAIKGQNATTILQNYDWDESVLGVIETA